MKKLVLWVYLVLLLMVTACTRHTPAPVKDINQNISKSSQPLSKQNKYQPKYVVVKKGDTLYSIGFSQSIDYKRLATINGINPPYNIYPGQKLRLKPLKTIRPNSIVTTQPIISKKSLSRSKSTTNNKVQIVENKKPVTNKIVAKPIIKKTIGKPIIKKTKSEQAPSSNYRWIWPVSGKVVSTFSNKDISRKGIDISVALGSSVYASNNGTVVYSGDGLRGYGELIIVKHSNNLLSAYAHNTSRLVKEGAVVKQGQVIAKSGKGTDGRALLHFEIRKNGQPVNPLIYLPKK